MKRAGKHQKGIKTIPSACFPALFMSGVPHEILRSGSEDDSDVSKYEDSPTVLQPTRSGNSVIPKM
jgi:hypothetical protein